MVIKGLPITLGKCTYWLNTVGVAAALDQKLNALIDEYLDAGNNIKDIAYEINHIAFSDLGRFDIYFTLVSVVDGMPVYKSEYSAINKTNVSDYEVNLELAINGFVFGTYHY